MLNEQIKMFFHSAFNIQNSTFFSCIHATMLFL
jgi:hypothetical protein